MHRPVAAVAVGVRFIAGKTDAGIGRNRLPFALELHLQLAADHHHMFNHPRLMRRGFTQGAGARVMEK